MKKKRVKRRKKKKENSLLSASLFFLFPPFLKMNHFLSFQEPKKNGKKDYEKKKLSYLFLLNSQFRSTFYNQIRTFTSGTVEWTFWNFWNFVKKNGLLSVVLFFSSQDGLLQNPSVFVFAFSFSSSFFIFLNSQ